MVLTRVRLSFLSTYSKGTLCRSNLISLARVLCRPTISLGLSTTPCPEQSPCTQKALFLLASTWCWSCSSTKILQGSVTIPSSNSLSTRLWRPYSKASHLRHTSNRSYKIKRLISVRMSTLNYGHSLCPNESILVIKQSKYKYPTTKPSLITIMSTYLSRSEK